MNLKRKIVLVGLAIAVISLPGCALFQSVPASTDFRLDFLNAVKDDCSIDKVAVSKDKLQIRCQPTTKEEF